MPFGKAFVYQAPKRKKSEVFWSGLTGPNAMLAADTNGTKPVIRSNNGSFTATSILLIAEQATRQTLISAV